MLVLGQTGGGKSVPGMGTPHLAMFVIERHAWGRKDGSSRPDPVAQCMGEREAGQACLPRGGEPLFSGLGAGSSCHGGSYRRPGWWEHWLR